MTKSAWMFTGDIQDGIVYAGRPGVELDRYSQPDEQIWRYMPLRHFREILARASLWFTRLSHYAEHGDRFEGSVPAIVPEAQEKAWRQQGFDIAEARRLKAEANMIGLRHVLVSCWHKLDFESAPMWREYGRGEPAIAVTSTLERLIEAVPTATVGHVEYLDYGSAFWYVGTFDRAFSKRREFQAEREVRAGIWISADQGLLRDLPQGEEVGIFVPVDLQALVTSVVVREADRFEEVLELMRQFELDVPVRLSGLAEEPRY